MPFAISVLASRRGPQRNSDSLPKRSKALPAHRHVIRVYYEDTDFSGSVYHAPYLRFLERGRTELLRSLDIHQAAMLAEKADRAFGFVVRAMKIDFLKPARMDDVIAIDTDV